jgi:hypothetical protein
MIKKKKRKASVAKVRLGLMLRTVLGALEERSATAKLRHLRRCSDLVSWSCGGWNGENDVPCRKARGQGHVIM